VFAVQFQCFVELCWCEVRGESEGESEHGCELCAEGAGAQKPYGHAAALTGDGPYFGGRIFGAEIVQQLDDVVGELVDVAIEVTSKGLGGDLVGTGSTAESEVDAAGIQCFEGAELFGDNEWSVIGEHDAAGADADLRCGARDMSYQNGSCCGGDTFHGVMFGEPISFVAELFGVLCECYAAAEGIGGRGVAVSDGGEVENG